jgi:hypothetical protein
VSIRAPVVGCLYDAVCWDVAPCGFIIGHLYLQCRRNNASEQSNTFRRSLYFFHPEDGGDTFLRNVGS